MPLTWIGEGYDYPADPDSGVTTARLTTTAKHHVNVYCEHADSSPDDKRIAILRSANADPRLPPFTTSATGHSQWLGDSDRVACMVGFNLETWDLYPGFPDGNLVTAGPDDTEPRFFWVPEHRFNHMAVSRCGCHFVCDSYWKRVPAPVALVVGNFEVLQAFPLLYCSD